MKAFLIVVNVIVPGLGTLFMGKVIQGILQLILTIISWLLMLTGIGLVIGFPVFLISLVWAFVVGIMWIQPKPARTPPASGIGR